MDAGPSDDGGGALCAPIGATCTLSTACCSLDCSDGECRSVALDAGSRGASPGALDPTFGVGGCVNLAYAGNPANLSKPDAIALDSTDTLFLAGATYTDPVVAAGGMASEFGWFATVLASGIVQTNVALPQALGPIGQIALSSSDEAMLVASDTLGSRSFVEANAEGTENPSFQCELPDSGTTLQVAAIAYQSSGRIIFSDGIALHALTAQGAVDTTFGGAAGVAADAGGTYVPANEIAIDSSDRIYVAGTPLPDWTTILARYTPEGAIDETFGAGGYITGPSGSSSVLPMVVSPSGGDIYLVQDAAYGTDQLTLLHVTAAGVDAAFGSGGSAQIVPPATIGGQITGNPQLIAFGLVVESDGKIVIGATDSVGIPQNLYLVRLLPSGDIDVSYGSGGWTMQSLQLPSQGVGATHYLPLSLVGTSTNDILLVEDLTYVLDQKTQDSAYVCRFLH